MLKHLMYNQFTLQDGIGKDLNLNFEYIDELQDLLGQWHDNKLALGFFRKKMGNKDLQPLKKKNRELEKGITEKADGFEKKISADNPSQPAE